ncbi:hypothetical protein EI534_14430 [Pseudomonas frederiksbergensis]|nr:hypothetical protein [Pseudomonas frederiksbergensis]
MPGLRCGLFCRNDDTSQVNVIVARELAPAGARSGPLRLFRQIELRGFTTASQPSGSKLPRHRGAHPLQQRHPVVNLKLQTPPPI